MKRKELLLLGSALNNTFEHRKWGVVKRKTRKAFGTERGSCLDIDMYTYTQNGRYTKTTFILFVSSALISSSIALSSMHKSGATLMGNLLNSGHLFSCHSWKNLFITNDKSTKWRKRKKKVH